MKGKSELGLLAATPAAIAALEEAGESPVTYFALHASGVWTNCDLCKADQDENEFSIRNRLRIFSKYKTKSGVLIYVETAADRSNTTLYLVEEY